MDPTSAILEIQHKGQMLVLKPVMELHDLNGMEIEEAVSKLLEHMDHSG